MTRRLIGVKESFYEAGSQLAIALENLYEEQPQPPLRQMSVSLCDLFSQLCEELVPSVSSQWDLAVIAPSNRMRGRFQAIREDHNRRNRYVADLDHYKNKLLRCEAEQHKNNSAKNQEKVKETEAKLQAADVRYQQINKNLTSRLKIAQEHKNAMVDEALLSMVSLLRTIHEQTATRLAALDQLSDNEQSRQAARTSRQTLARLDRETQMEQGVSGKSPEEPVSPNRGRWSDSMLPPPRHPDHNNSNIIAVDMSKLSVQSQPMSPRPLSTVVVRALYDYDATADTELDLRYGDLVTVLKQDRSGWWQGEVDGRIGW